VVGSGSAQSLPCANGLADVLRPDRGGFSRREAKLGQRPIPAEVAIKLNEFLRQFIADVQCARRDHPSGVGLATAPLPVVSETGTAARIPLGEGLEKCFGILFGCTQMPRLDGAIAAENYRYVRKAEPGRGIDRRLGASGHSCMWGPTDRNGRQRDGRLCSSRSLVSNFIQTPRSSSAKGRPRRR
jgi:hypothetical protein